MMKFFKNKYLLLLLLIVLIGAILRFSYISVFPPSMVQDEVGLGYSAISIAQTGKDEWGNSYPMVFKSFGDYKPPAFFYATALLYKVIGWNFALPRITSAIAGLLVIILGSLWFKKIFKSNEIGLIGGLILATSPWTVHLSRMALESNLGLAFFTAGLLFMSYAKKSKLYIFLSGLFFSLSTYAYHGYRFTVALLFISFIASYILINIKSIESKISEIKTYVLIFIISILISLPGFLSNGATNRLDQTLTFSSSDGLLFYDDQENDCHITLIEINPKLTVICKAKYNKITKPVLAVFDSYIKHLSPDFLFYSGDKDAIRNPVNSGEFYVFLFPFWMMGIFVLLKDYKNNLFIIVGYLVSLLPSVVSGNPHAIRLSILIPFVIATILHGYKFFKSYFKNFKLYTPIFIFIILAYTSLFIVNYTTNTFAAHESESTFLSYAKRISFLTHEYAQKGYVVYSDYDLFPEPHIYYAYWNRIDPKITQESFSKLVSEDSGFERPTKFGENIYFESGNLKSLTCNKEYNQPTIFITNDPVDFNPIKEIKENTNTHTFAFLYDLEEMRSQKAKYLNLCN